jgi:hypothetical protein
MSVIRKFVLVCACALLLLSSVLITAHISVRADGAPINITFEFSPAMASYEPGENLTINFTAVNTMPKGDFVYDDLAYMEKITNVSAHFGWMAPNAFAWSNVSGTSSWLAPDGKGTGVYALRLSVPANATLQTYSYFFRIEYMSHTPWGNITYTWGADLTYHDFVVAKNLETQPHGKVDYLPYLAIIALALAAASIGVTIYWRRGTGTEPGTVGATESVQAASEMSAQQAGVVTYPVIRATPGEGFPVEKGFIYLVKEKRPNISFAMFKEATAHGAKGMLVAREHPNRLKQMHEFEAAKILWLTRRVGVDHIDPTELSLLNLEITKFVQGMPKSVVLLEGLEYIITQNDFETVLRFVNHLHDFVLAHDCAVVIVIDPRVLSTRELALLERSARIVEPIGSVLTRAESAVEEQAA